MLQISCRRWDYKKKFTCKTVLIYLSLVCTVFWAWFTVVTVVDVVETEQYKMLASRLERAEGNAWERFTTKRAAEWEEKLLKVCREPEYEENIPYAEAFLEMAGITEE